MNGASLNLQIFFCGGGFKEMSALADNWFKLISLNLASSSQ